MKILVLGGTNNTNGKLIVNDASNTQCGYWDNTGLHISKGSIEGANIQGSTIYLGGKNGQYGTLTLYDKDGIRSLTADQYGFVAYREYPSTHSISQLYGDGIQIVSSEGHDGMGAWIAHGDFSLLESAVVLNSNPAFAINVSPAGQDWAEDSRKIKPTITLNVSDGLSVTPNTQLIINDGTIQAITNNKGFFVDYLYITGGKARAVVTETYNTRVLSAMESPTPVFSDIGSSICDEEGLAFISIDPIFAETIEEDCVYKVFYTQTNDKKIYQVKEKQNSYFTILGEPGATFDWIIYAPQKGYQNDRFEEVTIPDPPKQEESEKGVI